MNTERLDKAEYPPQKFTHLFPSGRFASISVQRRKDAVPEITGSGWPDIHESDWADYTTWRSSVVKPIMDELSEGELVACAEFARQRYIREQRRQK
jgi:hypothetical protein